MKSTPIDIDGWAVVYRPFGSTRFHYADCGDEDTARDVAKCIERLGGTVFSVRRVADLFDLQHQPEGSI